jgi:predicted naringenin-chalcone synthase
VLAHPSIKTRRIAVDSIAGLVSLKDEDPDVRVERFTRWAVELSASAVRTALEQAGLHTTDIDALIVNTCTGYLCPGISTYLIEKLGLASDTKAFDMVGSGCGGAMPNMQLAESIVKSSPGSVVVSVSVEICSATYEMADDISLILSNALFGDGAAATVVWDRPKGLELLQSATKFEPSCRDDVRYVHRGGRLHNRLSPRLPSIIGSLVPPLIAKLLDSEGLTPDKVRHWAVHPGGAKMLDEIEERLGLSAQQLAVARGILERYGNMSSPTVLFELEQILRSGVEPGEYCLMVAYGAGLSVHAYLGRVSNGGIGPTG